MNTCIRLAFVLAAFAIIGSHAAMATNAQGQANRCSALFMILTSVQETEPNLGQYFTRLGQLSGMMTAIYFEADTGKVATNGKISEMKSQAMERIGRAYQSRYRELEREIQSCIGWVVAIGSVMQQHEAMMNTEAGAKSVLLKAPRPSSDFAYPFQDFDALKPTLRKAFEDWVTMGMVTPNSIRDLLNSN